MALPLPSVVPDVGPGGAFITAMNAGNALKNNIYGTRIKQQEAKYAPYQAYGNAFLTNQQAQWLPYQYQMQALSNPMLWMAAQSNPALQKQLSQMMGNPLQAAGGAPNIPQPSQTSNGLLSMILQPILSKLGAGNSNAVAQGQGGGAPQNSMIPMPNQILGGGVSNPSDQSSNGMGAPNPLVPATGGPLAAVAGKNTAPYNTQVVKPGEVIYDPVTGKMISAPSSDTVTSNQRTIGAANRVVPQLQELADAAQPFQSLSGLGEEKLQGLINFVHPSSGYKLPTQYAKFQSLLASSPESLLKAYGLNVTDETIKRMQSVIEPHRGETGEQYKQRILDQIDSIYRDQVDEAQRQISQGFDVSKKSSAKNNSSEPSKNAEEASEDDINYTAKKYNMTPDQVKKYLGLK